MLLSIWSLTSPSYLCYIMCYLCRVRSSHRITSSCLISFPILLVIAREWQQDLWNTRHRKTGRYVQYVHMYTCSCGCESVLPCIVFFSFVLHCIVLYCSVLCCVALFLYRAVFKVMCCKSHRSNVDGQLLVSVWETSNVSVSVWPIQHNHFRSNIRLFPFFVHAPISSHLCSSLFSTFFLLLFLLIFPLLTSFFPEFAHYVNERIDVRGREH